jgi:hypothetical protein
VLELFSLPLLQEFQVNDSGQNKLKMEEQIILKLVQYLKILFEGEILKKVEIAATVSGCTVALS